MQSLWNEETAASFAENPLEMRVYSSRLLGCEPSLVLHGGGNTSVKAEVADLFGERKPILYVKGSGWDLATIEAPGFAPVCLETLKRAAMIIVHILPVMRPMSIPVLILRRVGSHGRGKACWPLVAMSGKPVLLVILPLIPCVPSSRLNAWVAGRHCRKTTFLTWNTGNRTSCAKRARRPLSAGKIALVTGAASGIGRACSEALHAQGAAVLAAVDETVRRFGGLDVVISNAGTFPSNSRIDEMDSTVWERSLQINLSSHEQLLQCCIPTVVGKPTKSVKTSTANRACLNEVVKTGSPVGVPVIPEHAVRR